MMRRSHLAESLGPDERRQLKLFAWFLLIVNLCTVGIGLLMGRSMDDARDAWLLVLGVGVLVNLAFTAIVGGGVLARPAVQVTADRQAT